MELKFEITSVKVMRSFDYCHFEVCLSSSEANSPEQADNLRKAAARLADKAVEQYKIAKRHAENRNSKAFSLRLHAEDAEKTPEDNRSVQQKADIKAYGDFLHAERYDYQDDWRDDDCV